ncbi:hypothetical protein [Azospirillum argentinense]|uniref:DUF3106 domain-containing protein n=1 Tax=Azospirillum brasilense TaxID=192 RepID=A0A4D8Q132_AZOBR|nr:hypothetical protein [Azospirillum argentinense]QCO00640.1 hypothetical protein D3867_00280 [Azospirillum argentinense]
MWSRRGFLAGALGVFVLAGCAGSGSVAYVNDPWGYPFYDDDWVYYYDEGDVDFLAGLTDEQKAALKQKWDTLSPEEKEQIRDRWNALSADERARATSMERLGCGEATTGGFQHADPRPRWDAPFRDACRGRAIALPGGIQRCSRSQWRRNPDRLV